MGKPLADGRRWMLGVFAVVVGATAASGAVEAPTATAGQDPCAASQVARTVGMVATSTGTYLDAHPETDQALTAISQQPAGPATLAALKSYFDTPPQEGTVLQQLQAPLVSLSSRCKLPLTLPQMMGLMQSAGSGTVPALPAPTAPSAALPPAQAVSATPGVSGWNPDLPGVTTAASGASGRH